MACQQDPLCVQKVQALSSNVNDFTKSIPVGNNVVTFAAHIVTAIVSIVGGVHYGKKIKKV